MAYLIGAITIHIYTHINVFVYSSQCNSDCLLKNLIIKQVYKDFNRTAATTNVQTSFFFSKYINANALGWETMEYLTANTWNEAAESKERRIGDKCRAKFLLLMLAFLVTSSSICNANILSVLQSSHWWPTLNYINAPFLIFQNF